jgi:acetylornithine deacetylase/succinyl-diaminopimelate desuccinylase-like protein
MLAANLVAMLLLQRWLDSGGGPLARDVIFLATADEETGGPWGVHWVLEHYPELRQAEFALNEGGRIRVLDRPLYAAVQTTEKVSHVLHVEARGTSGHASIPVADNPLVHLGAALATIGAHREPVELNATTREFFARLGTVWHDEEERRAMLDVASPEPAHQERGVRILSRVPAFDALLRNSISPTALGGGVSLNVIPAEAWAKLNVRTLPGNRISAVIDRLRTAIDDPRVTVSLEGEDVADPPASSFTSPLFEAMAATAEALLPGLVVVPYMSTGATDSAVMRQAGVECYGLIPFPMPQEEENRMHSHDERIHVDALLFGTRFLFETLKRVAS